MPKKNLANAALTRGRVAYVLELARGGSHIASTRSLATANSAIEEVLNGFCQTYGLQVLPVFQALLALEVDKRGNKNASEAVRCFERSVADGKK
jgi:hypothetical protein